MDGTWPLDNVRPSMKTVVMHPDEARRHDSRPSDADLDQMRAEIDAEHLGGTDDEAAMADFMADQSFVEVARTTEDPDLQQTIAKSGYPHHLLALIANPAVTDSALEVLESGQPEVHQAMVRHPRCPQRWLEALSLSFDSEVRRLAGQHPRNSQVGKDWALEERGEQEQQSFGPSVLGGEVDFDTLFYDPIDPNFEAHLLDSEDDLLLDSVIASHPEASRGELERIAHRLTRILKHRDQTRSANPPQSYRSNPRQYGAFADEANIERTLCDVAAHPEAPKKLLNHLAGLNRPPVKRAVAGNPSASLPALKRLLKDHDLSILVALAAHPSKHVRQLTSSLSQAADMAVDEALAGNRYVTPNRLEAFAAHESVVVVRAVAGNEALSAATLGRLADHPDVQVRAAVASNPYTAPDTLARLAASSEVTIATRAAGNPSTPVESLRRLFESSKSRAVHERLAANHALPIECLEHYASCNQWWPWIARNLCLPEHRQLQIARGKAIAAKIELAKNPRTTLPVLEALAQDAGNHYRELAVHSNRTSELLGSLSNWNPLDAVIHTYVAISVRKLES